MKNRRHIAAGWKLIQLGYICVLSCGLVRAQQVSADAEAAGAPSRNGAIAQAAQDRTTAVQQGTVAQNGANVQDAAAAQNAGVTQLDRVVAVVNDDLILESDVDEERRFAVFQPYSLPVGSSSRAEAIDRLVDRTLILQQARVQPENQPTDAQVAANLADLRKDIIECKQYKCDTDAGWESFLKANGFTPVEITKLWRERMETLTFIEQRFRNGISIPDAQARAYYTKTLLPQYKARNAVAPKFDSISDRIREILLQEQVSKLLDDWLKALRASGNVRMITEAEGMQ